MTHDNTARMTTASAVRTRADGYDVCLDMAVSGMNNEQYLMSNAEATALAEELLKAAGVKFKITVNA